MAPDVKLQLSGISKYFPGVKALDGVDVTLRTGTVHAVMGENGAGKSTLMKIINGLHKPEAGIAFIPKSAANSFSLSTSIL